jgi:hypothetical protein
MPILMMALLALVVFGLIGILLTVAVILEQSNAHNVKPRARRTLCGLRRPSLNPKLR